MNRNSQTGVFICTCSKGYPDAIYYRAVTSYEEGLEEVAIVCKKSNLNLIDSQRLISYVIEFGNKRIIKLVNQPGHLLKYLLKSLEFVEILLLSGIIFLERILEGDQKRSTSLEDVWLNDFIPVNNLYCINMKATI